MLKTETVRESAIEIGNSVIFQFGPFELRPQQQALFRDGSPVALNYRSFAVLEILVSHAGQIVERAELLNAVWKDCFVEEANLTVAISAIRKSLSDCRDDEQYIKTVSKHGYRFVGAVRLVESRPENGQQASEFNYIARSAATPRSRINFWRTMTPARIAMFVVPLLGASIAGVLVDAHSSLSTQASVHSVAVLPFKNSSSNASQAKLNIEITDDLIERLGENEKIVVRPLESVLKYANVSLDPASAGREQQVDAVLSGSVDAADGNIDVSVKLTKVKDGTIIWQGTFSDDRSEELDLENRIENALAHPLFLNVTAPTIERTGTSDLSAHRLYLQGLYFWKMKSQGGLRKSIENFHAATLKDPNYALAYSGLAESYIFSAIHNADGGQEAYRSAQVAAMKATQLGPTLAKPFRALGIISLYSEWNPYAAEQELRKAIQLEPGSAVAHAWYAVDLAATGRMDHALNQAKRAVWLDPASAEMASELGRVYYWDRQYDNAAAALQHATVLAPSFPAAHTRLGATYLMQRKYAEALHEFEQAKRLFGANAEIDGLIGYTEAAAGNAAAARRILLDLRKRSAREFVPAYSIALVFIGLGDRKSAFEWLTKSLPEKPASMVFAPVDPLFDPLRTDTRFSDLLSEIGAKQQIKPVDVASIR